jgi:hypothetical protein
MSKKKSDKIQALLRKCTKLREQGKFSEVNDIAEKVAYMCCDDCSEEIRQLMRKHKLKFCNCTPAAPDKDGDLTWDDYYETENIFETHIIAGVFFDQDTMLDKNKLITNGDYWQTVGESDCSEEIFVGAPREDTYNGKFFYVLFYSEMDGGIDPRYDKLISCDADVEE